ncbi:MAG: methyltransferase domain-containing protein [Deltaproteobacteria bacterium]|nr:methyltransferase domain-containing protein [Deltaproteobacteria bacterium]
MSASEGPLPSRAPLDQKGAERFDREVVPRWNAVFGKLLIDALDFPPKSTTLEVGCGTGTLTLSILEKADPTSRVIALDRGGPAMEMARHRAGSLAGRRVFFKTERDARLNFAPEVFDRVVANLLIADLPDPTQTLREMRRVLKRGGRLAVSLPFKGSYLEVFDLLREVLLKFEIEGAMRRLDERIERMPDERRAVALLEDAGFSEVEVRREAFSLPFRSSKELFADAIVETVLVADLRRIAGEPAWDRTLFHLRQAIDTYFSGSTFTLNVVAAGVFGTRPAVGVDLSGRDAEPSDVEILESSPDDEPTL